uniref:RanBP2-type domain-containing protein n=1 Tax=Meleagris gallopavo TaxID=9103 RepID=A0A803XMN6_MELGA
EYELAKRYTSIYLSVRERDPKAHRFLGQIYEAQDNTEKAFGCYKRSVELNPMQKDLVLKIAELLCSNDITDGRAEYWVEKAARLFPGNPAAYRLKEQLLECKGKNGWNQLFDVIQTELYARPDDPYLNIRLVALYRSNNRLRDAVLHCQEAEKKMPVDSSLEWCLCVIKTFEEYLESVQDLESDKNNWRTVKKDHLLAYSSLVKMTLASRDVQESRGALESFDRVLHSVRLCANGPDELSRTFLEMKGHFYMHAGTFLLKTAQNNEARWRDACELAALCYLKSFHIPKPKSKLIRDCAGQDMLEMLACDRKSLSGHMLLNLSHGKEDFLKEIVESFANKSGLFTLFESLFGSGASKERSFLSTDDMGDVTPQAPEQGELSKYDIGAVRMHSGSLQHLAWLGLQWNSMSVLFPLRRSLQQLFHLPHETSRLETDAPESICLLDLEVFLLGMVFTSNLELQEKFNTQHGTHQPPFLPFLLCKQYCTEKQRSWWDAVCTLMQKKTTPDLATKLKLLVQHGLSAVRALEKHGLQPALIIHWARSLQKTSISLNSHDQKEYIGRSVYYWKKILLSLKTIKKHKSIPEPADPLFKHFHSVDIQVAGYEEEAHIAFAVLDVTEGKTDDAILAFEAIKNAVSYWNLAILCQRKAEEVESDDMGPEEQEERKAYLLKRKHYLLKIIDESSSDPSVADKLPVSVKDVTEMLNAVIQELGEDDEEESLASGSISHTAHMEVKYSIPSPKKFPFSPTNTYQFSPKTLPPWAEDHKSLLQKLWQQVEALKNEIREMKRSSSNVSVSSHWWPAESYKTDTVSDGYRRAKHLHEAPLRVATSGPSVYCSQLPACNSQYLRRTAATNVTSTKVRTNKFAQAISTDLLKTAGFNSVCVAGYNCGSLESIYGAPLHFDAPSAGIISPHGGDDHNYGLPQASTNPPLPEPGYFTEPLVAPTSLKPAESSVSAAQDKLGSAFAKKEGQWECNISLVRNEPIAPKCVTCQNTSKTNSAVSFQEFSFKLDGKTPACTSQNPADAEAKPAEERCIFSMWMPPGGFKYGIQESTTNTAKKDDLPKECTTDLTNIDEKDKNELPSSSGVTLQCQETANRDKSEHIREKGTLVTPHVSRTNTAKASPCGNNAVAVLEEATSKRSDLSHGDDGSDAAIEALEVSSSSETPRKTVVSASKFVFRSESVKSVFSNEKTFPFGNTSAIGSLFGFSFNPPRKSTDVISVSQKVEQEKPEVAEPLKSCSAAQKPWESKASKLAPSAQDGPSNFSFKILEKGRLGSEGNLLFPGVGSVRNTDVHIKEPPNKSIKLSSYPQTSASLDCVKLSFARYFERLGHGKTAIAVTFCYFCR